MSIAPLVKSIKGVGVDEDSIGMTEYVRDTAKVENATFVCRDIFKEHLNEKYDAVCIFCYIRSYNYVLGSECGNICI